MKRFILLFTMAIVGVMVVMPTYAQTLKRSTWGQLKVIYLDPSPSSVQSPSVDKPGVEPSRVTGYRVKPYAVNEHWRDPNNPADEHVVMFFRISTNSCRYPVGRIWQGYERDWLNGWMLWVRYPSSNTEELLLFADGWWWWGHRLWNSAWGLSQQFELCF